MKWIKIVKMLSLGFFILTLSGNGPVSCASSNELGFTSLAQRQPFVTDLQFQPESEDSGKAVWKLFFSQRLDLKFIGPQSVALLQGKISEELFDDTHQLMDKIVTEKLPQIRLQYDLAGEETTLVIKTEEYLPPGLYTLIVTPLLRSVEGIPFNQDPGQQAIVFRASYRIGTEIEANSQNVATPSPSPPQEAPQYGPEPDFLVLHEILYDGISSEVNGEAFIELYGTPHADISGFQLRLINGSDGTETERIVLPTPALIDASGIFLIADLKTGSEELGQIENAHFYDQFDPQNGPDAVHLHGREGLLWDRLQYGVGAIASTPDGLELAEGQSAPDVNAGHSLSRKNGLDTNDNSKDFFDLSLPTPGFL